MDTAEPVDDGGTRVTAALRAALKDAMRGRDSVAASAVRSALSAIGNAEAVAVGAVDAGGSRGSEGSPGSRGVQAASSPHFAGAVAGLGAGEVARRRLSASEVAAIVQTEITERHSAAEDYHASGLSDQAERLRREADVLTSVVSALDPDT